MGYQLMLNIRVLFFKTLMLRESERKERNYQLVNINLNTYYIRQQQYSYYSLLYSKCPLGKSWLQCSAQHSGFCFYLFIYFPVMRIFKICFLCNFNIINFWLHWVFIAAHRLFLVAVGSDPHPLRWMVDSQLLDHQRSPCNF